jgi:hypothetical protein
MAFVGVGVFALGLLPLVVLTASGARRRGAGAPLAMVAGVCFPVTWAIWYVLDEHPYRRAGS